MTRNNKSNTISQEKIENIKQQNELLKSQLMTNSLINELTKVMHTTTDSEKIFKTVLLGIHEIADFDRIILFDVNKEDFNLVPRAWFGFKNFQKKNIEVPLGFEGGDITDAIFLNRHLIVDTPLPNDDFFCNTLNAKSYVVIPLGGRTIPKYQNISSDDASDIPPVKKIPKKIQASPPTDDIPLSENDRRKQLLVSQDFTTQGVFWMDRTKNKEPITSDDITTLSMIITQAGIIIENLRMFHAVEAANNGLQEANNKLQTVNQDLRTAQDKINKDLEHAQTIQQGLLPQKIPNTPALSLQASYIPATAVGGDYYDAFEITPGIYGIIVADVSGHGVSSALIMSMVKVLIKSITTIDSGPQKTLEKINEIFQTEIRTTNFVTVFYAILDTNSHELHYTSAGHCPVLFINKKERTCSLVKADGLFLGVFPDMMLHETSVPYEPGTQRLVLYTDGLTEARNNQNVMYELDRLIGISLKSLDDSADKACSRILTHQKKFCGKNAIPEDDITLLVVDF